MLQCCNVCCNVVMMSLACVCVVELPSFSRTNRIINESIIMRCDGKMLAYPAVGLFAVYVSFASKSESQKHQLNDDRGASRCRRRRRRRDQPGLDQRRHRVGPVQPQAPPRPGAELGYRHRLVVSYDRSVAGWVLLNGGFGTDDSTSMV